MSFRINALVNNLSDIDFKHLWQEFSGKYLRLLKQKWEYPYEYMDSFKNFLMINYLTDAYYLVL